MTDTQPKSDDCRTAVELALWRALQIARKERDAARREVCGWAARHFNEYAEHIARERGWDCYEVRSKP